MENQQTTLIGKKVRNSKGILIGEIKESIIDTKSGEITSILVKPSTDINLQQYSLNEQGDIIFPYHSLASVRNIFVVEDFQS